MNEEFGPKRLLKLREVAKLLSLSERWVWERAADGSLPVVRLKGATRVTLSDLEKFVEQGRLSRNG